MISDPRITPPENRHLTRYYIAAEIKLRNDDGNVDYDKITIRSAHEYVETGSLPATDPIYSEIVAAYEEIACGNEYEIVGVRVTDEWWDEAFVECQPWEYES